MSEENQKKDMLTNWYSGSIPRKWFTHHGIGPRGYVILDELIANGIIEATTEWDVRLNLKIDLKKEEGIVRKIAKDDFDIIWSLLNEFSTSYYWGTATITVSGPVKELDGFKRYLKHREEPMKYLFGIKPPPKGLDVAEIVGKNGLYTKVLVMFLLQFKFAYQSNNKIVYIIDEGGDEERLYYYGRKLELMGTKKENRELKFDYCYINNDGCERHAIVENGVLKFAYGRKDAKEIVCLTERQD